MCGFFSYLKKKNHIDLTAFNNASNLLKNRGPDGNRFYRSKNLLTKFYRLSIQDTSSKGMQPMVFKNRYVLVFNGEIYNFKELAIKFNFKLKSKSDSEVLLNLLILKGQGALKYLDGMFSFFFYGFGERTINWDFVLDKLGQFGLEGLALALAFFGLGLGRVERLFLGHGYCCVAEVTLYRMW